MQELALIKNRFREGDRLGAIKECEAICRASPLEIEPRRLCALMLGMSGEFSRSAQLLEEILRVRADDSDALFNLAVCEREMGRVARATELYQTYTRLRADDWGGWSNLAECYNLSGDSANAVSAANKALELNAKASQAWLIRAEWFRSLKRFDEAVQSYRKAIDSGAGDVATNGLGELFREAGLYAEAMDCFSRVLRVQPDLMSAQLARADCLFCVGRLDEAVAAYEKILASDPCNDEAIQKVCTCFAQLGRSNEALKVCQRAKTVNPNSLAANLGEAWVASQLVPTWHLPMMNEESRNAAYFAALQAAISSDDLVLEIGTGSGLLAMMAAQCGARKVVTCEAVPLIAETAARIIDRNGFADRIRVVSKPSYGVSVGNELPDKADVLVHEIFSSELLGEHVLPALDDAKRRLLKTGGRILPAQARIMVALFGGDDLGKYLYVENMYGFDLTEFNAIRPRKIPLYREDLPITMLSEGIEAFCFDFQEANSFSRDERVIDFVATSAARCFGVVQWIRLDFGGAVHFENNPRSTQKISNWQRTAFCFERPVDVAPGMRLQVFAAHDKTSLWFDLSRS